MSKKYQNKYRVPTNRAKWWDYKGNGLYFVTLCTADRVAYFGKVLKKKLVLSETGKMAWQFWQEIPIHFPIVELDVFIVMPDHIHGVIGIVNPAVDTLHARSLNPNETLHATSLQSNNDTQCDENKNQRMSGISPKTGSLPTVIRSYKSALTKWCNINNHLFNWQTRYYDHIIRNDDELQRIREYIIQNPLNYDKNDHSPH